MNRASLPLRGYSRLFSNDEAARTWFKAAWWPDGPVCPGCARAKLASIMREVADLNKEGSFAATGEMADAERAEFARYVRELPNGRDLTRQVELLGRRARQAFSPRMSKELIVTSSRMHEARRDWRGPDKASWDERMAGGE